MAKIEPFTEGKEEVFTDSRGRKIHAELWFEDETSSVCLEMDTEYHCFTEPVCSSLDFAIGHHGLNCDEARNNLVPVDVVTLNEILDWAKQLGY